MERCVKVTKFALLSLWPSGTTSRGSRRRIKFDSPSLYLEVPEEEGEDEADAEAHQPGHEQEHLASKKMQLLYRVQWEVSSNPGDFGRLKQSLPLWGR